MLCVFQKFLLCFFICIILQTKLANATDKINLSKIINDVHSKVHPKQNYVNITITRNNKIKERKGHSKRRSYDDIDDSVNRDIEKIIEKVENIKTLDNAMKNRNIQHAAKMRYVIDTMLPSAKNTKYFYGEMHRIIKQRVIMDKLRRMIANLEANEELKKKVLACYYDARAGAPMSGFDVFETNNLVINVVKDPFSDNALN